MPPDPPALPAHAPGSRSAHRPRPSYAAAMHQIPRDAPASIACGRSGLPLLAECATGHRRTVPFRLLKTYDDDRSPLYGRPFLCRTCRSREVTLFTIDSQAELDAVRRTMPRVDGPAAAPTNYRRADPDADLP